jgi:integrase/recombinase XerD
MLTLYRRHRKSCDHRTKGRTYRRCRCPIWVDGSIGNQEIRKSTDLRDWEKAQVMVREWEADGEPKEDSRSTPVTITEACEQFERDASARKLREKTIYKYKLLFRQLQAFSEGQGYRYVKEMSTSSLRGFRATWKDGNLAALKKLERLRTFFRFVESNKWITENPTAAIQSPKVRARPTMPFTQEDMSKIIAACEIYPGESKTPMAMPGRRLRALVLMLRYSGMRISDAVGCEVNRLNKGKLLLYTQKTGVPVYLPLPAFVVEALRSIPHASQRYFFWSGNGKLTTATGDWQGKLHKLFEIAKLPSGHAHRFRDTFATELLLIGIPLERVAVLLGHTSIRVTERHYSPWVVARQEQAEADVRRAWDQDPIALLHTKGTPQVHGKPGFVN